MLITPRITTELPLKADFMQNFNKPRVMTYGNKNITLQMKKTKTWKDDWARKFKFCSLGNSHHGRCLPAGEGNPASGLQRITFGC
jgi:hypothetical protein